jgi:hypothetical protein
MKQDSAWLMCFTELFMKVKLQSEIPLDHLLPPSCMYCGWHHLFISISVYYVGPDGWKKLSGDDVGELHYQYNPVQEAFVEQQMAEVPAAWTWSAAWCELGPCIQGPWTVEAPCLWTLPCFVSSMLRDLFWDLLMFLSNLYAVIIPMWL